MVTIKHYNELTKSELYRLLQLRNEIFIVEQHCPYQDIDQLDQTGYHAYIQKDDTIIAYARLIDPDVLYKNSAAIGRVLVKDKYRRQGYAKTLLNELIAFAFQQHDTDTITISAQTYLIQFYQGLGFKKVSDVYLEDDIPHVTMILNKKMSS